MGQVLCEREGGGVVGNVGEQRHQQSLEKEVG